MSEADAAPQSQPAPAESPAQPAPAETPAAPGPVVATDFTPKSDAHASLLKRIENFGEHLGSVLAQDFRHVEEAAKNEAMSLWKQLRQLLRHHGVTPTP